MKGEINQIWQAKIAVNFDWTTRPTMELTIQEINLEIINIF